MSQSTALVARLPRPAAAQHISPEHWRLITDVIWPAARDPLVIVTAWDYCIARKLDPLKRPVHIVPVWSKQARKQVETIWPGIGEIEITAARSGWAGMDLPVWGPLRTQTFRGEFENDNGTSRKVETTLEYPEWCAVTVYRVVAGERRAFSEQVFWTEAYARAGFRSELPNEMWTKRPRGQLGKVAKAAALRAAFPEEGGDYTADEMEGQEVDTRPIIDHEPRAPSRAPATNGQVAMKPPAEPEEWQPPESQPQPSQTGNGNGGSWSQPDYPIRLPDGSARVLHSGTEYLLEWRHGLERMGDQRSLIRRVRDDNRAALATVAGFDPQAAAEVEEMLDAALKEPGA